MNLFSLKEDKSARTPSFYLQEGCAMDKELLEELIKTGKELKKTIRVCLHKDKDEALHNMVIFHPKGGEYKIHAHPNKDETYQIIEGEAEIELYENGRLSQRVPLSKSQNIVVRINAGLFHVLVPKSDFVVFHECRVGPFDRENDSVEMR